jgi:hypothetical protein
MNARSEIEAYLYERKKYNSIHNILPSENKVIERLVLNHVSMQRVYSELINLPRSQWRSITSAVMQIAAFWSPDRARAQRQAMQNLRQTNVAIVNLAAFEQDDRQIAVYLLDLIKTDVDNEHYQYQQGFLDPGFYEGVTIPMIQHYGPLWREIGVGEGRAEFRREVDLILAQ